MTEQILEKIKALHNKAESAKQLGSEAEAQAFAAKVQELLMKYKLSMSEVEYASRDVTDQIEKDWIPFEANGLETKKVRVAWTEQLCKVITQAYCCKMAVTSGSNRLTIIGRHSDRVVAEFMFVTIARFLKGLADREQVKYYYECKAEGNVEKAGGFKAAFLIAFIRRLQERFDEEMKKIKAEEQRLAQAAGTACTSLMRIERSLAEVNKWMDDSDSFGKARGVQGRSGSCPEGSRRGKKAADDVNLKPNAVEGKAADPKKLLS